MNDLTGSAKDHPKVSDADSARNILNSETKPVLDSLPDTTVEFPKAQCPPGPADENPLTISFDGRPPDSDDDERPGRELIEQARTGAPPGYELLGVLGRGGMGVVYDARQVALKRRVALKMITAGSHAGPTHRARFQVEAEAVAALQHPNIVQIYEVGEHQGMPFFSLEYVGGGILQKKVKHGPMPPRAAAEMVRALAGAMHYAHKHGVVHRDLKPANVLLTEDGQPKIADFGLAKRIDASESNQTQAGTILGTPNYMAPEQAEGEVMDVGPPADVYALGAVLYHLLTGRPPFQGTTMLETLEMVRTQEPVPVRQLQPKVPRDLETICLKCLQKDARKRFADADALARDLGHFLAGEPIEARPVGKAERLWRWCRRHPGEAGLAATVFLLLATVAVTSSVLLVRIAREKHQTEIERQAAVDARDLAQRNETSARKAEALARENADAALKNGLLAVDSFYDAVTKAQPVLRNIPGSQKVRQQLLDDVAAGLQKVVTSAADSPLLVRTRIAAYQHMGDIARDSGRFDVALKHYRAGQALIEEMADDDPDNQVTMYNRAVVYERLGDVHHQVYGDGAAAGDLYRKSLAIRTELADAAELDPELKKEEARKVRQPLTGIRTKLGNLALMLGDPGAGWEYYRTNLERAFRKPLETPAAALAAAAVPGAPTLSINATVRLGDFAFHLADPGSARTWYESALRQSRNPKTKADQESAPQYQAYALSTLGDFELKEGHAARAKELYGEAFTLVKARAAADPDNAGLRQSLSLAHYRAGTAALRTGETGTARTQFLDCLTIREALAKEDPGNAYYQVELMLALARCGKTKEAVERADALRTRAPRDPAMLFFCACTYALCVGPDRPDAAKAAVDTLEQAAANGFRDPVGLKTDPDLDPVRDRPEFQQLVDRLESQAKSKRD